MELYHTAKGKNRLKRPTTEWEKIFVNYIYYKKLIPKVCK